MPFEAYFAHVWRGHDARLGARPARASRGRSPTCVALARELQRAGARRRARRSPRRRPCSSRASSACCRASAGRSRTTGGSASSCATASRRTGRAPRNSPATFGHFGRSGTFLWVDPDAGSPSACSPTSRSATGRPTRGRAWRTLCWPKQPCRGDRPRDTARTRPRSTGTSERRSGPSGTRTAYESRNSSRSAFSSSGWSTPDEVARAGDDDELRVLDPLREVVRRSP